MKKCTQCGELKPLSDFVSDKHKRAGYTAQCKVCRAAYAKYTRAKDPYAKILAAKKHICKKKGLPFDLDKEYLISIYKPVCPILGIEMIQMNQDNPRADENATLDRLVPELGYVKGNVTFMSFRANRLKGDASFEEIEALYNWMKAQQ